MPNGRRAAALLMCAALLLALAASSALVAHEAAHPHDCSGGDCPVCALIAQASGLRRELGLALLAMAAGMAPRACVEGWSKEKEAELPALRTLASLKIRLND